MNLTMNSNDGSLRRTDTNYHEAHIVASASVVQQALYGNAGAAPATNNLGSVTAVPTSAQQTVAPTAASQPLGPSARSHSTGSSGSGGRATPPALFGTLHGTVSLPNQGLSNYGGIVASALGVHAGALGRTPPPHFTHMVGRRHGCKLCPMMFESKAELQIHTQVHMREAKPYKCTHCPKSFANSSYLSQHMRIHLGIKPFGPCQYCGRKFTQLSHLQQHLRTHTGEKPYKCRYPGCEKAFSQLSNLQSHSRCHQTDKPFKCNSCYKCFSDEQSLLEHIPKHNETKHVKKCICPYCGKSYSQPSYLAKHMTKHADKKPVLRAGNIGEEFGFATPICAIHQVPDTCGETSPPTPLPFSTFPAHSHTMAPTSSGVYGTNSMSGMGNSVADPASAFTRLTHGLGSLAGRVAATTSRGTPYFTYENFKSNPHSAAIAPGATAFHNQLIPLGDIRQYANMPADHFQMLVGRREPREAAY